ncbi:hypothetical protein [Paracoccus sp. (in: a-proteobacteria)]|uniref:hypothetical protein n=1 Tax=Paracoccus sp. TaxID=267 RepID=UPI00289D8B6C|nr:hypothetical protein [Paracoccus sp. (in: a-proteobacteria)]
MRLAQTGHGAPADRRDLDSQENKASVIRPGLLSRLYLSAISSRWAATRLSRQLLARSFDAARHSSLLKEVEQEAPHLPARLLRLTIALLNDRQAIEPCVARGLINALRYEDYRRMQDIAVLS